MTNQRRAPEAMRLAEEITELMCSNEAAARRIAAAADELCRLHYENQRLAALVEAQQPACGNTPYDEGPFTLAQQPSPSAQQPFGWIKQHEIDVTNKFGGSISLWRRQYDCDVPVYLAPQPSPPPQADSVLEDAARYRWLRNPTTDVALVLDKRTGYVPVDERVPSVGGYYTYEYRSGDELDAAVDAARKQGGAT